MSDHFPPAPHLPKVGRQQGPPTRVAASDSQASLRDARGSLPSTPLFNDKEGDGLPPRQSRDDVMIRVDTASWQRGFDAGLSANWSGRQTLVASTDRWSWVSGYIEGDAARQKRGSQATSKLDANREY